VLIDWIELTYDPLDNPLKMSLRSVNPPEPAAERR
jgi:hypothetical protein